MIVCKQIRIGQILRVKNIRLTGKGKHPHWLKRNDTNQPERETPGWPEREHIKSIISYQINYFTSNQLLTTSTPHCRESPVNRRGCARITRPGQGVPSTGGTLTRAQFPAVFITISNFQGKQLQSLQSKHLVFPCTNGYQSCTCTEPPG